MEQEDQNPPIRSIQILDPTTKSITSIKILYPITTMSIITTLDDQHTSINYFHNKSIRLKSPHMILTTSNNDNHPGVIFPMINDYYGMFETNQELPESTQHESTMMIESSGDLISKCEKLSISGPTLDIPFSMTPPVSTISQAAEDEEINESIDPCEFLTRRYYSTLYSLNNPLSYFPKTALPRFKNMCSENDNVVDSLKGFSLTLVEFDSRHNHKYGLFEHDREVPVVELHEREHFKTNHGFSIEKNEEVEVELELKGISVEKFSGLCLNLKIREAQLQMLVIFEILSLMEIDELEFLERNKKIQADTEKEKETKAKQSLIRRRNKKNNKKAKSQKQVVQSDEYLMFSLLTNLIDRLSLWDTLSTKTEGSGTYGFMAYVLVPYFNKKLPNLIKHVIENMKGSNMKLISFKRKKEDDHEKPKSKSKYKKVLLEKKPPQLSKSTSLAESDDFKPLTSLKRSESNLSTKYLSKREVDLNIKQASKNPLDVPSSQSFIFASQAKRSKSTASIPTITNTHSQREVMATPRKPKFMKSKSQIEPRHISSQTQVQATPAKPKDNSYHSSSLHTVEATPNTSITSVVSTPMNLFAKPDKKQNSINEKLLSASKEVIIDATPRKLIIEETPPKGFGSPTMLETPIQRIQSSPIQSQKKSKPGDPISMETSPFVNVLKDSESLMSFKPVKLFNDEEYDSDELLNPKKKVVRTTYSKRKK